MKGHALPIVKIRCKNVSKAALMLMFHAEHLLPCGTTQIWQRKKEKKKVHGIEHGEIRIRPSF